MSYETLIYELKDDGILWIRFNRPRSLNAVNRVFSRELREAVEQAEADPDVKVVILTGEGRAFCAGADLKEAAAGIPPGQEKRSTHNLQTVAQVLRDMRKVAIAAVNGYALGAGCEISLDCDLVVASEEAKFGFPETGVGATVTGAGTYLLPQGIGLARAKELIFLGEHIPAAEAKELGMINRVVPADKLEEEATAVAKKVLEKSPMAIALAKAALNVGAESNFGAALTYERDSSIAASSTGDMVNAGQAFKEKRPPKFGSGS